MMASTRSASYTVPAEPLGAVKNTSKQQPDSRSKRLATMRPNNSLAELQRSMESSSLFTSTDMSQSGTTGTADHSGMVLPAAHATHGSNEPSEASKIELYNPIISRDRTAVAGTTAGASNILNSMNSSSSPDRSILPRSSVPLVDYDEESVGIPLAQPPLQSRTPPKNEPNREWRKEISDDFTDSGAPQDSYEETDCYPRGAVPSLPVIPPLNLSGASPNVSGGSQANTPRSILKRDGESPRRSGRRISFVEGKDEDEDNVSNASSQQSNEPALHYSADHRSNRSPERSTNSSYTNSSVNNTRPPAASAPEDENTYSAPYVRQDSYGSTETSESSVGENYAYDTKTQPHALACRYCGSGAHLSEACPQRDVVDSSHTADSSSSTGSTTSSEDFISPVKPERIVAEVVEEPRRRSGEGRLPARPAAASNKDSATSHLNSTEGPKELSHTRSNGSRSPSKESSAGRQNGSTRRRRRSSTSLTSSSMNEVALDAEMPPVHIEPISASSRPRLLPQYRPADFTLVTAADGPTPRSPKKLIDDDGVLHTNNVRAGSIPSRGSLSDSGGVNPSDVDLHSEGTHGGKEKRRHRRSSRSGGERRHKHRSRHSSQPSRGTSRSRGRKEESVPPEETSQLSRSSSRVMRKKLVVVTRRKSGERRSPENDPVVEMKLYPISKKKELVKSPKKLETLYEHVQSRAGSTHSRRSSHGDETEEGDRMQFREALSSAVSRHSSRRSSVAPASTTNRGSSKSRHRSTPGKHRHHSRQREETPKPLTLQELLEKIAKDNNSTVTTSGAHYDPHQNTPFYRDLGTNYRHSQEREGIIPIHLKVLDPIVRDTAPRAMRRETDITVSDMTEWTRHNSVVPTTTVEPVLTRSRSLPVSAPQPKSFHSLDFDEPVAAPPHYPSEPRIVVEVEVPLVDAILPRQRSSTPEASGHHNVPLRKWNPGALEDSYDGFAGEENSLYDDVGGLQRYVAPGRRVEEPAVEHISRGSQTPLDGRSPIRRPAEKASSSPPYAPPPIQDENLSKLSKEWQTTLRQSNDKKKEREMYLLETAAAGAAEGDDLFLGGSPTREEDNKPPATTAVVLPTTLLPLRTLSPEAETTDPSFYPYQPVSREQSPGYFPSLSPLERSLMEEEEAYHRHQTPTKKHKSKEKREKKRKDSKASSREKKERSRRSSRHTSPDKKKKRRHSRQSSPPLDANRYTSPPRDSVVVPSRKPSDHYDTSMDNMSPSVSFVRSPRNVSASRRPFAIAEPDTQMQPPPSPSSKKRGKSEREKRKRSSSKERRKSKDKRRESSARSRKSSRHHREKSPLARNDSLATSLEYQLAKIQLEQHEKEKRREERRKEKERERRKSGSPKKRKHSTSPRESRKGSPDRKKDKKKEKEDRHRRHSSKSASPQKSKKKKEKKRKHTDIPTTSYTFPNVFVPDEAAGGARMMSPSAELSSLSSIPDTRRKSESSHKDYFSDKESNAASTGTRSKYAPLDDYREKKRAEAQSALSALRERRAQAEKEQSLVDLVEVEAPPSVTSLRSVPLRPSTRWEDYVKEAEREARRGSTTPRSSGGKVPSRREGSFEDIPYPSSVSALNRYYHDRKRETVPAPVYVADDPQDDPPPKHYFDQPAENTREHTPTRPVEKVAHREPSVHDTKRPSPSPAEENKYNNNNNRNNGEKIVSDPLVCKNFAQKINQMSSALEFFYSN